VNKLTAEVESHKSESQRRKESEDGLSKMITEHRRSVASSMQVNRERERERERER
jgi:hypothetical protein